MRLRQLSPPVTAVAAVALVLTATSAGSAVAPAAAPSVVSATTTPAHVPTLDPLPRGLRGKAWERIPTRTKVVALTFDAGGGAGGVRSILRTLEAADVPATFFLTGRWARAFPAKVRRIAMGGYVLGNHTDTHAAVPSMSDARLSAELRSTDRAVRAAAGRGTGPWFRFPYGSHARRDVTRVNDLGYAAVQWSVDSAGWMGTSGGMSVRSVVDRVLTAVRPGAIVLMHVGEHPTDGSTLDADALPRLITELRDRDYTFTTVEALP